MVNVAVLVSGGGTNLQALIDYEKSNADCPYHIALVVSSTKNAYAIERAGAAGIKCEIKMKESLKNPPAGRVVLRPAEQNCLPRIV